MELFAPATQTAVAHSTIQRVAETLHLRIDGITEKRGLLSTRLTVVLTGTGEQIEGFRETLEGDGSNWGGGPLDQLVLNPLLGALQRRLAKRWRMRPPRKWGAKPTLVSPPEAGAADSEDDA